MSSQIRELQSSFEDVKKSSTSPVHPATPQNSDRNPGPLRSSQPPPAVHISRSTAVDPPLPHHGMSHCSPITDNWIDEAMASSITEFLGTQTFNDENGHSVITFGHPYSYTGSKSSTNTPPIPSVLEPLFDKVNSLQSELYYEKYPTHKNRGIACPIINSCLVNRYTGPDSHLPQHADKETTIHPESSIFTLSLGQSCELKFTERSNGVESVVSCSDRSFYHMTRKSQEFFEHRIDKGAIAEGIRYSLTFRSVDWKNRNSTCLIGDSNTGNLVFGTSKRSSFGELMPGQRFWAACIENIDPLVACAYNNIVVMCGINNLKDHSVKTEHDVNDLYHELKCKIKLIRMFNPKANIFICPILPTKNHDYNRWAVMFNHLIFNDLVNSELRVIHVFGFARLLDRFELLAENFSRNVNKYGQKDVLHLNHAGTRLVANLIKTAVFLRLNKGIDKRRGGRTSMVDERPYNSVVKGPQSPQRRFLGSYQVR